MSATASLLENYLYELPDEKIAKYPLSKRDESKLLLCRKDQISHEQFENIADFIPKNSTLFLNNTKVIAARLFFHKSSGAKIEVFLTEPISPHTEFQKALKAKNKCTWKCMIGNLKKWKDENVLSLDLNDKIIIQARLINRDESVVEFLWEGVQEFLEIIEAVGHVPLPPYLNRAEGDEDKERYQTVFSELEGAVAAPTAGLHFTDKILSDLNSNGIKQDKITLHVSAGTFRPIKEDDFRDHDMHNERIIIHKGNIENILLSKGPIISVGTTAMRTLESAYWYGVKLSKKFDSQFFVGKNDAYNENYQNVILETSMKCILKKMEELGVDELRGETEIFIYPGYEFKVVNGLFTNFHMPGSTLILLVAAFIGENWKNVYTQALEKDYRFLSYGDTSLLLK